MNARLICRSLVISSTLLLSLPLLLLLPLGTRCIPFLRYTVQYPSPLPLFVILFLFPFVFRSSFRIPHPPFLPLFFLRHAVSRLTALLFFLPIPYRLMGAVFGCCSSPVDFDGEVDLYHFDLHRAVGKGAFGKVSINVSSA